MTANASKLPKKKNRLETRNVHVLYVFLLPALISTLLFAYLPMFSNYIAFTDYDFNKGFMGLGSPFVGFANFKSFLTDSRFYSLMGRTLYYSIVMVITGFPAPFLLALMLNELRHEIFKRTVQTVSYIPHFVSWVTVGGLIYIFLSADRSGLFNNIAQLINPEAERISFMQDAKYFLRVMVLSDIWKEAGYGTILYLAALATIDSQLYEAAKVDGAGRIKCLIHITMPGLFPTMCIILIFVIGGLFSVNFDQVFNLQNNMIRLDTDTIGVYTYYQGMIARRYGYSAAVGLFQGIIAFILVRITNQLTKGLSGISIF